MLPLFACFISNQVQGANSPHFECVQNGIWLGVLLPSQQPLREFPNQGGIGTNRNQLRGRDRLTSVQCQKVCQLLSLLESFLPLPSRQGASASVYKNREK